MDFVRSHFGKMQLWQVEHFFLHKKVPVVLIKVFNLSELHFSEVTSYKIHTLIVRIVFVHFLEEFDVTINCFWDLLTFRTKFFLSQELLTCARAYFRTTVCQKTRKGKFWHTTTISCNHITALKLKLVSYFMIGWNSRISKFPLHWLFGRLSHAYANVCKLRNSWLSLVSN